MKIPIQNHKVQQIKLKIRIAKQRNNTLNVEVMSKKENT